MICALLIFQTPDLPGPLSRLSPWLDWLVSPQESVFDALSAQEHRRFIKTHTPLDGIPVAPGVTYIVVARHPLDMAVSLYHQSANLNRDRIAELTGQPATDRRPRRSVEEWLQSWIDRNPDPREQLDSLPGIMWHFTDAWNRRHDANVILVHYDDLCRDLPGRMRRLASRLHIDVPEKTWPRIVSAATFQGMKSRAELLVPDPSGVLKSHQAFFRQGSSGSGKALLTPTQAAQYRSQTAQLAPADLLTWLHRETTT